MFGLQRLRFAKTDAPTTKWGRQLDRLVDRATPAGTGRPLRASHRAAKTGDTNKEAANLCGVAALRRVVFELSNPATVFCSDWPRRDGWGMGE